MKEKARYRSFFVFFLVSILYAVTRWVIFKGFNGTDDLHYAMLAAKMLKGEYNPFQPDDIFSGRILLIASQAAIYKVGGIGLWTTQAGSLLIIILSCYLTVCKLLPDPQPAGVFLASSFFYFNPLITFLAFGPLADVYVLLGGILICLLLRSWIQGARSTAAGILTGALAAVVIGVFLLFKETMIVFLPLVAVIPWIYDRKKAWPLVVTALVSFGVVVAAYAGFYLYFTGDPFFKIIQITNSSYLNHCSYDLLPSSHLVARLTYEVFQEAISRGFYPVIIALAATIFLLAKKGSLAGKDPYAVLFALLFLTGLYFPFSFHGYQPLCSDTRQFLFLLPLGTVVSTRYIRECVAQHGGKAALIAGAALACLICVLSTGNKWQWMIWLFIFLCFAAAALNKKASGFFLYLALPGILWSSILEHRFFQNSNWLRDMRQLSGRISSQSYYFPDHDNMMHWQLLHGFDQKHTGYFNLCEHPFKWFGIYYQHPVSGSFHPGWFILNRSYTVLNQQLVQKLDSIGRSGFASRHETAGDISAFYIDEQSKLAYIQSLMPHCE